MSSDRLLSQEIVHGGRFTTGMLSIVHPVPIVVLREIKGFLILRRCYIRKLTGQASCTVYSLGSGKQVEHLLSDNYSGSACCFCLHVNRTRSSIPRFVMTPRDQQLMASVVILELRVERDGVKESQMRNTQQDFLDCSYTGAWS